MSFDALLAGQNPNTIPTNIVIDVTVNTEAVETRKDHPVKVAAT